MDKYEGINRPETVYTQMRYQTIKRNDFERPKVRQKSDNKIKNSKPKGENTDQALSGITQNSSPKNKYKRIFKAVRYAACLLLLGVCLLGKFTQFKPAIQASDYIKTELERDITQEIIEK